MHTAGTDHDWDEYPLRQLNRGAMLGCGLLLLAFLAGAFCGIMVIWLYQELGFRS